MATINHYNPSTLKTHTYICLRHACSPPKHRVIAEFYHILVIFIIFGW